MKQRTKCASGFSMIELLFAAAIFSVIAGGVFSILLNSQIRYRGESGLTNAFQDANTVMDQITRDIHSAGFPPPTSVATGISSSSLFAIAFPWSPNYPNSSCVVGATCATPGDYDLILETDPGNGVQWIRYYLNGTTLQRGTLPKQLGDPLGYNWSTAMTPYLENVVNQTASPQRKIFTYSGKAGATVTTPADIYEVNVSLMVQSSVADPQTGARRTITLTGQAVGFNLNQ